MERARLLELVVMKSNAPSPRFLHEFDTVDTLAMKNISEKHKLERRLRELDKQLHSNLVRIESEILSIRLENTDSTPAALHAKRNEKGVKNNVKKGKTMSDVMENSSRKANEKLERNVLTPKSDIMSNHTTDTLFSYNTLPKITTTSYLTVKHEDFEENMESDAKLSEKNTSLETISEMGQKQQQAEQRILMSLRHPRSQQKTQPGNNIGRPSTPQAPNQLLSPLKPSERQRRASSHGCLLAPLSDEYVTKGRTARALSAPDVGELSRDELGQLRGLSYSPGTVSPSTNRLGNLRTLNKQKPSAPDEVNGLDTVANGVKICVTNENGRTKTEQKPTLKASLVNGGRESKTPSFDDVMIRRLQLLENGVPNRDELETIRYLRLRDEHKNTNDVRDVFADLHQNNSD